MAAVVGCFAYEFQVSLPYMASHGLHVGSAGFGAVFNYDILSTFTGQESTGGALLDLRAFSPYGVLQSSSSTRPRSCTAPACSIRASAETV